MATPWDRAAEGYLVEWVPRFTPYHLDLVRELALEPKKRVLVTSSGPGAEVLAVARAVGPEGKVRATDKSAEMVRLCDEQVRAGAFTGVRCEVADASDVSGGPWDAIVCAFGLWQIPEREALVQAWSKGLAKGGKVGVLTWGPPDREGPFELLAASVAEIEPLHHLPSPHVQASRDAMAQMFERGGLAMVRHTVVRHTLAFASAERFVAALREACTWRKLWEELGDERIGKVAARFYDRVGGATKPLSFESPATIAIAGLPGDEIALAARPSIKVPAL